MLAEAVLRQAAGGEQQEQPQRELHLRLLRTLDLRCPAGLDAAVDAVLPAGQGGEAAGEEGAQRQAVLALLTQAFEGTARCPLLDVGTTVMAAAEAPAAAVRLMVGAQLPAAACCCSSPPNAAAVCVTKLLLPVRVRKPCLCLRG